MRKRRATRSLSIVRRIVTARLRRVGVTVWLFGSFARGEAHRGSDIDVAVRRRRRVPPGTLTDVRAALEESTVPYRVDLVDWRDASPALRRTIRAEGVRWAG